MAIAKTLVLSTIISCAVMAAPAAAETSEKFSSKIDVKKNADGTYESEVTTDSTDAAGTRVKR